MIQKDRYQGLRLEDKKMKTPGYLKKISDNNYCIKNNCEKTILKINNVDMVKIIDVGDVCACEPSVNCKGEKREKIIKKELKNS